MKILLAVDDSEFSDTATQKLIAQARPQDTEVRVLHVMLVLIVVIIVGVVVAAFTGYVAVGWLNQKNLNELVEKGAQTAQGYTPAKSPTEAMDRFHDAIQKRKYKSAALYVTKPYAEQLTRGHDAAAELGAEIDFIERYADNGKIKSEKLAYFLHQLDPFPKNFKVGPAPKEKDGKAYGSFVYEALPLKTVPTEIKDLDVRMFNTSLRPPSLVAGNVELVKEGEEWKLNVPIDPAFEAQVSHFKEREKTYHTGLHALSDDLNRQIYDNKSGLERDVLAKLRAAKD